MLNFLVKEGICTEDADCNNFAKTLIFEISEAFFF